MAQDDDGKGAGAPTAGQRSASVLLATLVATPDGGLKLFRDRRLADKSVDLEHLKRARDILAAICGAMAATEGGDWARIERAWRALQAEAGGDAPRESGEAPASAPPVAKAPPSSPGVAAKAPPSSPGDFEPPVKD